MNNLRIEDFVDRVMTSHERVQFSQVDPYGHLNASRYAEFVTNHRITAVEDQTGVSTYDIIKTLGIGFVVARLDLRYQAPSFLGETIEIASWIELVNAGGIEVRLVLSGAENKKVRATALMSVRTVDVKTGRPVACPESLPSRLEGDVLSGCPLKVDYLSGLKNLPNLKP